jgi:hypothetical protein
MGAGVGLNQTSSDSGGDNYNRPLIVNNTIVQNRGQKGGGIYSNYEKPPVVFNTIFWNNSGEIGPDLFNSNDQPMEIQYNNLDTTELYGNWRGETNVFYNPNLMEDMLHLNEGSDCCNAGVEFIILEDVTLFCPPVDIEGDSRPYNGTQVDIGADEFTSINVGLPEEYLCGQGSLSIYPNPFSKSAWVSYSITKSSFVRLEVFNMSGQMIEILINEIQNIGEYQIKLDVGTMPEGIYFCMLMTNQGAIIKKVIKF